MTKQGAFCRVELVDPGGEAGCSSASDALECDAQVVEQGAGAGDGEVAARSRSEAQGSQGCG